MMDVSLINKNQIVELASLLDRKRGFCVLTGAGVSTQSGLPAYRDESGRWKHSKPMQHQDFISSETKRKFYWARSMLGWPNFNNAQPSQAHLRITDLVLQGFVGSIITQNVDRLHHAAGCENTLDLHGRLDQVVCLECKELFSRHTFQSKLEVLNPDFTTGKKSLRPDGDVDFDYVALETFDVPVCEKCSGALKPNVVFFGDVLDRNVVSHASQLIENSSGLLVIGSSLMVYSGYRYVKQAVALNKPVVIINQGKTRADDLYTLKIEHEAGQVLTELLCVLTNSVSH